MGKAGILTQVAFPNKPGRQAVQRIISDFDRLFWREALFSSTFDPSSTFSYMDNPKNQAPFSGADPKVIAVLSYLTVVGWIAAVVLNNPKSELASFHIRQSLGLMLVMAAGSIVMIFPLVGWIVGSVAIVGAFFLWILGFLSALQGEMKESPYLGAYFQEWFKVF